jgi:NADH/NAD ratio-sensing transcriptional regulator Rex
MKPMKIPEKTVTRLSIYLRCLEELEADGVA